MDPTPSTHAALAELYRQWAGEMPTQISMLPPSGSNRSYYRLSSRGQTAIGTYNAHKAENQTFLYFTEHFRAKGIPVPAIYATNLEQHIYLQEDLGDITLYSLLPGKGQPLTDSLKKHYKNVVAQLAHMQIIGGEGLDYNRCYATPSFDMQTIRWDLNSFKYHLLIPSGRPFHEASIENEFQQLARYLCQAPSHYFMFRDFQSRNIMIREEQPYFIDYQGGRKGPLPYDLASLLYQAKANLPDGFRHSLLTHYLDVAEKLTAIQRDSFEQYYYAFILIRSLQVLGTYGLRGLYEGKPHFLQSIPYALRNALWAMQEVPMPVSLPHLRSALTALVDQPAYQNLNFESASGGLMVTISSFSYKRGWPEDTTGHGGGFVFDCRAIHNPGRYDEYKKLTGLDASVQHFLQYKSDMPSFLKQVYAMVSQSVAVYLSRGFASLTVSFGCTGGQHRSVYAAECLAQYLRQQYPVAVKLQHREEGYWPS